MRDEFSRIEIPDDLKEDFDSGKSAILDVTVSWWWQVKSWTWKCSSFVIKNPKWILDWLLAVLVLRLIFTKGFSLEILKEILK